MGNVELVEYFFSKQNILSSNPQTKLLEVLTVDPHPCWCLRFKKFTPFGLILKYFNIFLNNFFSIIIQDFSIIDTKLDNLITQLPDFSSKCDNFTKLIQGLNTNRRSNNLTLQKHNQLLEILEISQLMDTCVRNEYVNRKKFKTLML